LFFNGTISYVIFVQVPPDGQVVTCGDVATMDQWPSPLVVHVKGVSEAKVPPGVAMSGANIAINM
jgi:hypothetical protein